MEKDNTPNQIIGEVAALWRGKCLRGTLAHNIVEQLRANGYVIKRAVPPCRAHDFEDNNDAA